MKHKQIKFWKLVLVVYFAWAVYHTLRDVFQILHIDTFIATVGYRYPNWCGIFGKSCSYLTFPLEIYNLVAIPLIWNKNKIGITAGLVLVTIPLAIIMWLWP